MSKMATFRIAKSVATGLFVSCTVARSWFGLTLAQGLGRPISIKYAGIRRNTESGLLPERVGRNILFSRYPVRGTGQVANGLQILPPPPNAPAVPFLLADHPFVVEFLFRPSDNIWVNSTRQRLAYQSAGLFMMCCLKAERPYNRYGTTKIETLPSRS